MKHYHISAKWDGEAKVFVASCDEIGLATEADSYDALVDRLSIMVPELVSLNDPQDLGDIEVDVTANQKVTLVHAI